MEGPKHPFRSPAEIRKQLVESIDDRAVDTADDLVGSVRWMLMTCQVEAWKREDAEELADQMLTLGGLLADAAGLERARTQAIAGVLTGLGALAPRLFDGRAGVILAVVLLLLAGVAWASLMWVVRLEALAPRVREAGGKLADYLAAHPPDPTGVRVDTGTSGQEPDEGASSETAEGRKATR